MRSMILAVLIQSMEEFSFASFCFGNQANSCIFATYEKRTLRSVKSRLYKNSKIKGLSPFKIIYRHALKNALNPVITAVSGWFASMLAGAVFVEYIFGWNGLGKEIVNALNTLDLPVIMGAVLTIALTFILINIIVDIIYAQLDPKIKF